MRIFVTGGSGFVGQHVLKELDKQDVEILLLLMSPEKTILKPEKSEIIYGDLNNLNNIQREIVDFNPQVCMHFAWQGIPDYSETLSKINLNNSIKLCDLLVNETNCKKIIISGSCFEYGRTKGACKENQKTKCNSFFSWAKQSLCNYLTLLCKHKNVNIFWGRIFYVYGPMQRKGSLIPAIVDSFMRGQAPQINKPLNANDFVYVEDIAEAFCMAAKANIPSGVYNIGSGVSTEVIRFCKIIEKELFGSTNMTNKIINTTNSRQELNFWADTSKSKKYLRWFAQTNIQQGIRRYLKGAGLIN